MHAPVTGDGTVTRLLALQLGFSGGCQRVEHICNPGQCRFRKLELHRLLTNDILVRQAHAVSAQHPGQRMHKHPRHAKCISDQTRMLAARAAKTLQRVAGHVIAARNRNLFYGVGHLLHGNVDKAFSHIFCAAPGLQRQFIEFAAHRLITQRFICIGTEHFGKVTRLQLADEHIRIGHRQRAAAPVARRPRIGAGALRPDAKAFAVKFKN